MKYSKYNENLNFISWPIMPDYMQLFPKGIQWLQFKTKQNKQTKHIFSEIQVY